MSIKTEYLKTLTQEDKTASQRLLAEIRQITIDLEIGTSSLKGELRKKKENELKIK